MIASLDEEVHKSSLTDLPTGINFTSKGVTNLEEVIKTFQIDSSPEKCENNCKIDNSLVQSISKGWYPSSKIGNNSKQPNLVRLHEDLEIPAFHGCDYGASGDARVPADTVICEPLNHIEIGICPAASIVNIIKTQTKTDRNIVVRILNTTPMSHTVRRLY